MCSKIIARNLMLVPSRLYKLGVTRSWPRHMQPCCYTKTIRTTRVLSSQRELSWPKHDVTERIMMLADHMGPEATLLIGFSWYALQHQTEIVNFELTS
jgi:hypothetical protein